MKVKILGIDPSFANFGLVGAVYDTETERLRIDWMRLIETTHEGGKKVRKNSDDLRRARELYGALLLASQGVQLAVAEIPTGAQSARAAWSLGIVIGVLASCRAPLIEVTPNEVKLASVGRKTASKDEMIAWAVAKHSEVSWLYRKGKPLAKNEHLADAVAAIYAGIRTEQFKGMMAVLRAGK